MTHTRRQPGEENGKRHTERTEGRRVGIKGWKGRRMKMGEKIGEETSMGGIRKTRRGKEISESGMKRKRAE